MTENIQKPQEDLIQKARSGDRRAFELLMERQCDRLLAHIEARLGRGQRARIEAEDIFQETVLRAFQSLERFEWRGEDSFFRWIASIATHRILEAASQAARAREERLGERERILEGPDPTPSRSLGREERFDRLEEALSRLPEPYREALVLARLEGCPSRRSPAGSGARPTPSRSLSSAASGSSGKSSATPRASPCPRSADWEKKGIAMKDPESPETSSGSASFQDGSSADPLANILCR